MSFAMKAFTNRRDILKILSFSNSYKIPAIIFICFYFYKVVLLSSVEVSNIRFILQYFVFLTYFINTTHFYTVICCAETLLNSLDNYTICFLLSVYIIILPVNKK